MNKKEHCSFCGRGQDEVSKLFSGIDGSFICDECIETCFDMLGYENDIYYGEKHSENSSSHSLTGIKLPTPKEIKEKLDEYVIGQDSKIKLKKVRNLKESGKQNCIFLVIEHIRYSLLYLPYKNL